MLWNICAELGRNIFAELGIKVPLYIYIYIYMVKQIVVNYALNATSDVTTCQ